jgi:pimeloyl-ACP methyl ester carboxylesterase
MVELEATVRRLYRPDPIRSVIVGMSEGGLVATLALERHPEIFEGGLAGCGPIGDFQGQLNYIGDFRVIFDFLFPGIIPGNAVDVPEEVQTRWESFYVPAIVVALAADYDAALALIRITGAPVAGHDLASIAETTVSLLWYDVFGMADARARLGGQPFDNATRVYSGSGNDAALNSGVDRFNADPVALSNLTRFETTGNLEVPVSVMHTTGDPIVPFGQSDAYAQKVSQAGQAALFEHLRFDRYGHCSFQSLEILAAFTNLMQKIGGQPAALLMLTR